MIPTSGRYLLDTNIIITLLNGETTVKASVPWVEEVYIPIISIGELLYGAAKSARPAENRELVKELVETCVVQYCDFEVANEYGKIKHALRRLGKPIPENDMWIAAIARRFGLTLVSRDHHLQSVPGLPLQAW